MIQKLIDLFILIALIVCTLSTIYVIINHYYINYVNFNKDEKLKIKQLKEKRKLEKQKQKEKDNYYGYFR